LISFPFLRETGCKKRRNNISRKTNSFQHSEKIHNTIHFFGNAAASSLLFTKADQERSLQRLKFNGLVEFQHENFNTRVLSTGNFSTKNNNTLKKFSAKLKKGSAAVKNLKKFLPRLHGKGPSLPKPQRF
jgi:hypothetical protein